MANQVRVGITAVDEGFSSTIAQMEQNSAKFATSLNKSGKQASTFNGQLRSLKKQALELSYAYEQLDEQTKQSDFGQSMKAQLQEVLNTAGQMQDIKGDVAEQIKNIASDTRTWDGMKEGIGVVSSSLQGLASVYGMLGGDTKQFAKALVAVNAVQSISNTIIGIGNALQKQSALMTMLRTAKSKLFSASLATENTALAANAAANVADAAATSTATAATWSFNAALAANPIGMVVVAVAALAAGIYALTQIIQKATPEEEGLAEATQEVNNATQKSYEAYKKTELELRQYQKLVESFNGTAAEEKRLVEQLNNELGNSLGKYKDLKSWKDALNTTSYYYCRVLQVEAKYNALAAAAAEAYAKAMSHEDYSKNMAKYRALEQEAEKELDNLNFLKRELARSQQLNPGHISSSSSKSSKSSTKSTKEEKTALEQLDEQIKNHEKELASLDKTQDKNIDTINKLKSTIASLRKQKLVYIDTTSISGLKEYKKELSEIRKLYPENSDSYKNINGQIETINNKMLTMIETMSQSNDIELLSEAQNSLNDLVKTLDITSGSFQRAAKDVRDLNNKIEDINQVRNNLLNGVEKGSITWLEQDLEKAQRRLDEWKNSNKAKFALTYDELEEKKALEEAVRDAKAALGDAKLMMDAHLDKDDVIKEVESIGTSLNMRPIDLTFDYKKTDLEKVEHQIDYINDKMKILEDIKLEDVGEEIFSKAKKMYKDFDAELKDLEKRKVVLEVDADLKEATEKLNNAQWDTIKGTGSDLGNMYSSIKGIGEAFNDAKDPVESFFKAFDSVTSVVDNILDLIDLYKELNAAITAFNAVKEAETALTVKNAAVKNIENEQQTETLVQKQTESTIMQENAAALGEQVAATTALNIVKETSNVLSEKSAGAQAAEAVALGTSTSAIGAQAAAETAALAPKEAAVQVNQQLAVAAMDMAAANIAAAHSEIPFVGPALAAAGIATVTAAAAAAHGTMVGLQAFAEGGIVKGSTTMGDGVLVRMNAGEMALNNRQQQRLFDIIDHGNMYGENMPTVSTVKVAGSDIYLALKNYGKIKGKGIQIH